MLNGKKMNRYIVSFLVIVFCNHHCTNLVVSEIRVVTDKLIEFPHLRRTPNIKT